MIARAAAAGESLALRRILAAALLALANAEPVHAAEPPAAAFEGCAPQSSAIAPDGRTLVIDCGERDGLWRVDADGHLAPVRLERGAGNLQQIVFAAQGSRVALIFGPGFGASAEGSRIQAYDLDPARLLWTGQTKERISEFVMPGIGDRIMIYAPGKGYYRRAIVMDGDSGAILRELPATASAAVSRPLSPDGKVAVLGDSDTNVVIAVDVASGNLLWQAPVRHLTGDGAEFVQDGRAILAYGISGFVKLDPATGAVIGTIAIASGDYPDDVQLGPDGEQLLTKDGDLLRVLRIADGVEVQRLKAASTLDWFGSGNGVLAAYGSGKLWFAKADGSVGELPAIPGTEMSLGGGRLLMMGREITALIDGRSGETLACWGEGRDSCAFETARAQFKEARDPANVVAAAERLLPLLKARQQKGADPEAVELLLLRQGAALLALGREEQARRALDSVTGSTSVLRAGQARHLIAEALLQEGRAREALKIAQTAVTALEPLLGVPATSLVASRSEIGTKLAEAAITLAEARAASGDSAGAERDANTALALAEKWGDPFDRRPLLIVMQRRAELLRKLGRFDQARAAHAALLDRLRNDVALTPLMAAASLSALADIDAAENRPAQAVLGFARATDLMSVYIGDGGLPAADIRTRRAALLIGRLGRMPEGVEELRSASAGLRRLVDRRGRGLLRSIVGFYWQAAAGTSAPGGPAAAALPTPDGASRQAPSIRHRSDVLAAAYSPDGRYIASASRDGRVILWDVETGKVRWKSDDGAADIQSLSWAPGSDRFLTEGAPLQRWQVAGGDPERLAARGWPDSAYARGGSRWVASGERALKVFDTASGALVATIAVRDPKAVALSPDGSRIAVFTPKWIGSDDGELCLHIVAQSQNARCEQVTEFANPLFSNDGARLYNTRLGDIEVRDGATLKLLETFDPAAAIPRRLALSRDGKLLFWAGTDGVARVLDAATGVVVRRLEGHLDWVQDIDISPDGKQIVTASKDATVRRWDAATGAPLDVLGGTPSPDVHREPVTIVAFSKDGTRIVTASDDDSVRLWNAADRSLLRIFNAPSDVQTIALSTDESTLFVGAGAFGVQAFSVATGAEQWKVREPGYAIATLPDRGVLVAGSGNIAEEGAYAQIGPGGAILRRSESAFEPDVVKASEDGSNVLLAGAGKAVLYDPKSRRIHCMLDLDTAIGSSDADTSIVEARFVDGGARLIEAGDHFGIWRTADCRPEAIVTDLEKVTPQQQTALFGGPFYALVRALTRNGEGPRLIGFAPDGGMAAAAWEDGTLEIVDAKTGGTVARLLSQGVNAMIFSPDGSRLLLGTDDGAFLFDGRAGRYLGALGE